MLPLNVNLINQTGFFQTYLHHGSSMISTEFPHDSPLHSPHATIHFKPCFQHEPKFLRHTFFEVDLHLQLTNFRLDSGAGQLFMSVLIGFNTSPTKDYPLSAGFKQCRLGYLQ